MNNINYISILMVSDHRKYINKSALLLEINTIKAVYIIKTTQHNAIVRHVDGALQKVTWNKLYHEKNSSN